MVAKYSLHFFMFLSSYKEAISRFAISQIIKSILLRIIVCLLHSVLEQNVDFDVKTYWGKLSLC